MHKIDISTYKKKKKASPTSVDKAPKFDLLAFLNQDITFGNGQLPDKKKEEFYLEFSKLLLSGLDLRTAFDLVLLGQNKQKGRSTIQRNHGQCC